MQRRTWLYSILIASEVLAFAGLFLLMTTCLVLNVIGAMTGVGAILGGALLMGSTLSAIMHTTTKKA
jgi:hypothetical protein